MLAAHRSVPLAGARAGSARGDSTRGGFARGEAARAAVVCASILGAAAILPPERPLPLELCLLHRLTGFPCPTCGLTRSICLLIQGHAAASLAMHPAGALAVLLLAVTVLWRGAEAILGRPAGATVRAGLTRGALAAGGLISIVFWVSELLRYQR